MKIRKISTISLALLSLFMGYQLLYSSLENDGLKQTMKSDRESIKDLLRYAKANSQCDTSSGELIEALGSSDFVVFTDGDETKIERLALSVKFKHGRLNTISILGVQELEIC